MFLAVVSSDVIEEVSLSIDKFGDIWVDLNLPLRKYFPGLVLACTDDINTIYRLSMVGKILTLNLFSIDLKPAMPLLSFSLFSSVTCLGWTVIFSISKLYCLTSKIASEVSILVMRFSAPISVSFAFT